MLTKRKREPLTVSYACFWPGIFDKYGLTSKQAYVLSAVHVLQRALNKAVYHDHIMNITGFGPKGVTWRLQELKDLGFIDGSFAVNLTPAGELMLKELDAELFRRIDSFKGSHKWTNQNKNPKVKSLMFPAIRKGTRLIG